jgi:hypothetical protein
MAIGSSRPSCVRKVGKLTKREFSDYGERRAYKCLIDAK